MPKRELRQACLVKRRELATLHPTAARDAATRLTAVLSGAGRALTVAGYMTLEDELDCRPALAMLQAQGLALALPVARAKDDGLSFRAWQPGAPLERGPFGTLHPMPEAQTVDPDLVLVPLVAFDTVGHRLGYGAGYYDRALAALRVRRPILAMGLAYDGQEIATIPAQDTDQRLDAVVTDRRVLWFDPTAEARLKAG